MAIWRHASIGVLLAAAHLEACGSGGSAEATSDAQASDDGGSEAATPDAVASDAPFSDAPASPGTDAAPDGPRTCATDSDCLGTPGGAACTPGGVPFGCGVCVRPDNPCGADSDCLLVGAAAPAAAMVCGPGGPCTCAFDGKGGSCIPACQSASDCGADEACQSGHCVAKPCTVDADCPGSGITDFACSAGKCTVKGCQADSDCHGGYCVDHACASQAGMCAGGVA